MEGSTSHLSFSEAQDPDRSLLLCNNPRDMQESKRSCVFLSRRKEGDDPDLPRRISVSYDSLQGLFHLPLADAARETGLCTTTFKKACRRFNVIAWPYRKSSSYHEKQRRDRVAPRNAQTDGVDAAVVCCISPVWHDGSSTFSSISPSSSNVTASSERHRACINPASAVFAGAAPQGLLQQTPTALDTRSYGEASMSARTFATFATFAQHNAPSYVDMFTQGRAVIGVPLSMPEGLPTTQPCGGEQVGVLPLEAGTPGERSCVETVMEYLDFKCSISEADIESMLSNDY